MSNVRVKAKAKSFLPFSSQTPNEEKLNFKGTDTEERKREGLSKQICFPGLFVHI